MMNTNMNKSIPAGSSPGLTRAPGQPLNGTSIGCSVLHDVPARPIFSVYRCNRRRCATCAVIKPLRFFRSSLTKRRYTVISTCDLSCSTTSVIYLISCAKCDQQYVGETKQKVSARLSGHRSSIKKHANTFIARHFNLPELLLIINSFVFSRLFYCSSVWSNTSATNIHKLQLVQNFAARIILGLRKYDHISAGLRSLRWLNVKQRLMVNDAVMMDKCLKGLLSPCYLSNKFSTRATIHDRQTRYRDSLNIPSSRINAGQRAFYYRGVKVWNNLSRDLKEIINAKVFKRRLINELIRNMSDF